jgi:threonine dehydratase
VECCEPCEPTLAEIFSAQKRIRQYIYPVIPRRSSSLSDLAQREVWLIPENTQRTGSFKFRGALNRMLLHKERGGGAVITASSGNHAIGTTVASAIAEVQSTVVVPSDVSKAKLARLCALDADVLVLGEGFDDAENLMYRHAEQHGIEIVNSFDPDVISGHATVALNALRQVPDLQILIAPVASGGLLAGCALVLTGLVSGGAVYGVQTTSWPAMHESLRAGHIVDVEGAETVADGLAGNASRSQLPFQVIKRLVRDIYLVDEQSLLSGVRHGLVEEGFVLEGAGAATIGAILAGVRPPGDGPVGLILSGGNTTESVLKQSLCH